MNSDAPACRSCSKTGLEPFLALGETPLADRLITPANLSKPEPRHSLSVHFCPHCALVQIVETVPPEVLFCDDYPYYSSVSDALARHSRQNAEELIQRRGLGPQNLVVELASNDGYLLRYFVERGVPVLGIDPAEGPAKVARERGIETLCTFFTTDLARELRSQGKQADVILGNNVLAHVADLNGFVAGIKVLLGDRGIAVIEVPYVRDLIDHCEFDTIYHEHLCYYSVTALTHLFKRHGLSLNEVRRVTIHGGSLRLFIEHEENVGPSVVRLLDEERSLGVDTIGYYRDFAGRVERLREDLLGLLRGIKREGGRLAAYGAAAKGATMINYVGIGTDLVEYVVDRNIHKHGCYMPGMHLPIHGVDRLVEDMPDFVLLLAWNFADEIMQQQQEYIRRGGRFIIPVPHPRVAPA